MDTAKELAVQWINPSDVLTVLMIIGGDVVRTALAQASGTLFTPVCFSFGWVAYIFMALIGVLGDGRLLPPPDYPVKVFNLQSGYVRDNRNWVLGRILRDHEASASRTYRHTEGIRIMVFEAQKNLNCWTKFSYDWTHVFGLFSISAQLAVAALPAVLYGNWSILLITGAGTILALTYGALPQWTAEKLPNRQHSDTIFGLTTGSGSRDILIIKGNQLCLNLEQLATTDTPRNDGPWEKFSKSVLATPRGVENPEGHFFHRTGSFFRQATDVWGTPSGFWITMVVTVFQTCLWLLFLITVASVKQNTWYLLAVGLIGMFQNAIMAAIERPPKARNLPLSLNPNGVIRSRKVMDGLMDLEDRFKCARPLVKEFFPGKLRDDEEDWWKGRREAYELKRMSQRHLRGVSQYAWSPSPPSPPPPPPAKQATWRPASKNSVRFQPDIEEEVEESSKTGLNPARNTSMTDDDFKRRFLAPSWS